MFDPPHPGLPIADILKNGDLTVGHVSDWMARHLGITRATLSRLINGRAAVSADMALRLEGALGVKAEMWLRLRVARGLWIASH